MSADEAVAGMPAFVLSPRRPLGVDLRSFSKKKRYPSSLLAISRSSFHPPLLGGWSGLELKPDSVLIKVQDLWPA